MTRGEAVKALIAGKHVDRTLRGTFAQRLRWSDERGLQVLAGEEWVDECSDPTCAYREVWTPRVFLGVWEEVKTFEEAEKASESGRTRHWWCERDRCVYSADNGDICLEAGDYWVKRKAGR